ncbi:MAG: hypothetical protein JO069_10065 [Verrucomicrobia bacterium]|nr:hypothetical protein [Verrucomicrobiota bacterium]
MEPPPHEPLSGGPSFHDRPLTRDPEGAFLSAQRSGQSPASLDGAAQALSHALLRRMLESDARNPAPRVPPAAREALTHALATNERALALTRESPAGADPASLDPGEFDLAAIEQALLQARGPDGTVNLSVASDFLQTQVKASGPQTQIVLARAYGRVLQRLDDETLRQEEEAKKGAERRAAGLL